MKLSIPENKDSRKDISIETIRGIALILMVSAHVIGSSSLAGMKVDDDSFWRYLYKSFVYIRMPLFTVISGYVYALRPVEANSNLLKFIKGKFRRLLLPLITIGTAQYLFQCFTPGVNKVVELKNIWQIYVYPYNQFWFLQAILIIFLIVAILDYYSLMSSLIKWSIVLSLACILFIFIYSTNIFNMANAIFLLPFFLLGCGIKRFEDILLKNRIIIITSFLIFIIGMTISQLAILSDISTNLERKSLIGLLIGLSSTFLLVKFRFKNKFLAFIGYYSYGIYLLHIFGTAGSRIFMGIINLNDNKTVLFFISLTFGIVVPLIIQFFIYKSNLLKTIILGLKYKKDS